jgi:hypothetical protein
MDTSLKVSITTESSVLLSRLSGDQNTVRTFQSISGNQVRGLLAERYRIQNKLEYHNIHKDPNFFALFLSENLLFSNCRLNQSFTTPLFIQKDKLNQDNKPLNIFESEHTQTVPINKLCNISENINDKYLQCYILQTSPSLSYQFHNSRPLRSAGKSTAFDPSGGIYYYESLDENQTFIGYIYGTNKDISLLKNLLGTGPLGDAITFGGRLGRSRSAQYGKVLIKLSETNSWKQIHDVQKEEKYLMICLSPLILYNEFGTASPTIETLINYLPSRNVEILKAISKYTEIEQFNSIHKCKTDKCLAYEEGSTFLLKFDKHTQIKTFIGENTATGYGEILLHKYIDEGASVKIHNNCITGSEITTHKNINIPNETSAKALNPARYSSPVFINILQSFQLQIAQLEIDKKALEKANGIKTNHIMPSNHLIARIQNCWEVATNINQVNAEIKEMTGKKAADGLEKANLLQNKKLILKYDSFDQNKRYYLTLLNALRLLNKKSSS